MSDSKHKFEKNNNGFTLIELIVVMAIIVAIAGGLAIVLTNYVGRSKRAVDINTGDEIAKAFERNIPMHPDLVIQPNYSFDPASTVLPTEATAVTLFDFMLTDFERVPTSRADETYSWTIIMDIANKKVDKIYLATSSGGTDYEVYPDGAVYLKGP